MLSNLHSTTTNLLHRHCGAGPKFCQPSTEPGIWKGVGLWIAHVLYEHGPPFVHPDFAERTQVEPVLKRLQSRSRILNDLTAPDRGAWYKIDSLDITFAHPTAKMRTRTASSLLSALRALSIAPTAPRIQPCQHTVRGISHSVLSCSSPRQQLVRKDASQGQVPTSAVVGGVVALKAQQTRGMKVHSSIKKRCEHCKVSLVHCIISA